PMHACNATTRTGMGNRMFLTRRACALNFLMRVRCHLTRSLNAPKPSNGIFELVSLHGLKTTTHQSLVHQEPPDSHFWRCRRGLCSPVSDADAKSYRCGVYGSVSMKKLPVQSVRQYIRWITIGKDFD